jgi:hypothetical protein
MMGRILFFVALAFCAFLALRIVANARRKEEAVPNNIDKKTPENQTPNSPALALAPCPLCALHLPSSELAAHLQQAHGAT